MCGGARCPKHRTLIYYKVVLHERGITCTQLELDKQNGIRDGYGCCKFATKR